MTVDLVISRGGPARPNRSAFAHACIGQGDGKVCVYNQSGRTPRDAVQNALRALASKLNISPRWRRVAGKR